MPSVPLAQPCTCFMRASGISTSRCQLHTNICHDLLTQQNSRSILSSKAQHRHCRHMHARKAAMLQVALHNVAGTHQLAAPAKHPVSCSQVPGGLPINAALGAPPRLTGGHRLHHPAVFLPPCCAGLSAGLPYAALPLHVQVLPLPPKFASPKLTSSFCLSTGAPIVYVPMPEYSCPNPTPYVHIPLRLSPIHELNVS